MISTGNSVVKATRYLQTQNCGSVYVACTHALLVNGAEKRIKSAGVKKIVSANTVPGKNAVVDISDIVASSI
jgi:ribose-phosphate pyrophosphokinase